MRGPFFCYFLALLAPRGPTREIGRVRDGVAFAGAIVADGRLLLTLGLLGEQAERGAGLGDRVDASFAGMALGEGAVMLERLVLNGTVALVPLGTSGAVARLQPVIAERPDRAGVPLLRMPRQPHVTLGHQPRGSGRQSIDRLGWDAERSTLVESRAGRHVHRRLASWPVRPAPPALRQMSSDFAG